MMYDKELPMNRKMTIKTAAAVLLLAALTALFTGCAGKNSEAIVSTSSKILT